MTTCMYCHTELNSGELCPTCSDALGLVGGQGVRRAAPCARCNHPELIRALVRELSNQQANTDTIYPLSVPMGVTYEPSPRSSGWSNETRGVYGADATQPVGILEMYVCLKCGFTEWYCRDPKSIPIGVEYGTEKIVAKNTPSS